MERLQNHYSLQKALPCHTKTLSPLIFRNFNELSELQEGEFGVKILNEKKEPVVQPDIVLVPFLGFNSKKYRIGYGGGYYDMTINTYRKQFLQEKNQEQSKIKICKFIGVGYEFQYYEDLVIDKYDQKLDAIVTEAKIYQ